MTLLQLCACGIEELVDAALRMKLKPWHVWVAMAGAEKYRDAVKSGDIAPEWVQQERLAKCAGCPSITWSESKLSGARKGWCGDPFVETATTCGCFVAVTLYGDGIVPAAKTVVASESCPQKRWEAVQSAVPE